MKRRKFLVILNGTFVATMLPVNVTTLLRSQKTVVPFLHPNGSFGQIVVYGPFDDESLATVQRKVNELYKRWENSAKPNRWKVFFHS